MGFFQDLLNFTFWKNHWQFPFGSTRASAHILFNSSFFVTSDFYCTQQHFDLELNEFSFQDERVPLTSSNGAYVSIL